MKCFFSAILIVWSSIVISKPPPFTTHDLLNPPPRVIRVCCAFGSDMRVSGLPFYKKDDIVSVNDVGTHHYLGNRREGNGIVYTKHGGFIDLGHLRDYADWTAYLYNLIEWVKEHNQNIILKLGHEGGLKTLSINSADLKGNVQIPELAGRIAYDLSVWHEIATWFGASSVPFFSEQFSSFSPEDLYSNLLGVKLGIEAIKSELAYEEAMTILLSKRLDSLAVVSINDTYTAMEKVNDLWWTRSKSLPSKESLLRRHLSTSSEANLYPMLVQNVIVREQGIALGKPKSELGQFYTLRIQVNNKFSRTPWKTGRSNRIVTHHDFDEMIRYIAKYDNNLRETPREVSKVNG